MWLHRGVRVAFGDAQVEELPPSKPEEMPRVTVELEAMEILVWAYLDTCGEKQRRRFLKAVFRRQAQALAMGRNVIPLHDRALIELQHRKRQGALAWTRARLPAWMIDKP